MDVGRLGLTVGARFDDYSADYGPATVSGSEVSPNIGGDFEVAAGLWVFAGYSEAVRGSSIIPIQWLSLVSDDVVINHGNAIEPEKSTSREGGIRYSASDLLLSTDRLSAQVAYFDTRLTNTLEVEEGGRRGAPITAIYNNPETLRSKGYEVKLTWGYRQVETQVSFSSFKTEDSDGNPVGNIRRKTGATGNQLVWDTRWRPRENLTLGYTLNFVADLTDVPEGDDESPGYTLHGIQAAWQPQLLPALTLSLAVDNLLDEHYRRQTSFKGMDTEAAAEPGRDIRLAMTYCF
jgi:hemoglobin/transferrin/lactoferrin receptor protein